MSLIHAFQELSLIPHKGEINRKSCGAPATIPLQPSMHKPCLPPWPLTPQPLSDPRVGAASSKRIPQSWEFDWANPPPTPLKQSAAAPVQSDLPPPPSSARDWLTTHLLHAACPLLYCVSIINKNLARFTGMTFINTCLFTLVKRGSLCSWFGSLSDRSRSLMMQCLLATRRRGALWKSSDRWTVEGGREWTRVSRYSLICFPGLSLRSRTFQRSCQLWGASGHLTKPYRTERHAKGRGSNRVFAVEMRTACRVRLCTSGPKY